MKGVVLLSNGIDSPVAAHMMKRKGLELVFLHLWMGEDISELKNKISPESKLVTRDFLPVLREISEKTRARYRCLLCKRAMFKQAEKVALEEDCEFIITGENLGQVASQTLENMAVIESSVSIPVLRPLLCFDKKGIMDIAEKIGTYGVSINKNKSCPFVPDSPATKAKTRFVEREENQLTM